MQLSLFKTCVTCNESKLFTQFAPDPKNIGKRRHTCKQCRAKYHSEHAKTKRAQRDERYMEKERRKSQNHHQQHKADINARKLQSRKANPVIWQIFQHRRRARMVAASGDFTASEFKALCEKYGNVCLCCKEPKTLTADHIVPLSKGGSNDLSNIQPLCLHCNTKKATKTTDYRPFI